MKKHFNLLEIIAGAVFIVLFCTAFIYVPYSLFKLSPSEKELKSICSVEGGEPYLYKTGWSKECGFDVYRGTCVRNGLVNKNVDIYLVEGKVTMMEEIPNYPDINSPEYDKLFNNNYKLYSERIMMDRKIWVEESCKILGRDIN